MDNPETLATQDTQDKEKQNKNTTQYVLDTAIRKQTQTIECRDMHLLQRINYCLWYNNHINKYAIGFFVSG